MLLCMLFLLSGFLSTMAAYLEGEAAPENHDKWLDLYNNDDLFDYEDCNNKVLDVRDLDTDFDWQPLSVNALNMKKLSKSSISGKKSMKKKKKSPEPDPRKRKRSEFVKRMSSLKQPQQRQQPQVQPQQQRIMPRFETDPIMRKLRKSNHAYM